MLDQNNVLIKLKISALKLGLSIGFHYFTHFLRAVKDKFSDLCIFQVRLTLPLEQCMPRHTSLKRKNK